MRSVTTAATLFILLVPVMPAFAQQPADNGNARVITNPSRAKAPIAFSVSDKASYDVGGLKDNPDDELNPHAGYLRSIVLSDGRHVVDDDNKLRYFDAAGKQVRVTGRSGQGPGEFRQISGLCRTRGDTVIASDPGNARVTILDATGNIVREIPVGRTYLPYDGCFDDGTWVIEQSAMGTDSSRLIRLVRYNNTGTVLDTLGTFWAGQFSLFMNSSSSFAVRGMRLYVADPRASEVRIYDTAGKLTEIVRSDDPIIKTTASEREAMMPRMSPATSDQAILDRFKERLRTTPRPTEWPAFARMMVDPDGRIWIEDYHRARTDPSVWTAFSPAGRLLGRVSFPPFTKAGDPRALEFTSGGVMIRREDDDGAEHLTVYPLLAAKGGRP